MIVDMVVYAAAFVAIWIGAGFIIGSVSGLAHYTKLTPFAISFFVLGVLTSIPEIGVGLTAVSSHNGEIFVGNLLGGVAVLFLFVIPILALLGNGVRLTHTMGKRQLAYTLAVVLAPSFAVLDRRVTNPEGAFLILLYLLLFFVVPLHGPKKKIQLAAFSIKNLYKLGVGMLIVFLSSNIIVEKTFVFSEALSLSPYLISFIALSFGTNLPELSLAIRSVVSGKNEVALGDYIGSAAANTLLFGVFTLMHNGEVIPSTNFTINMLFTTSGVVLFYYIATKIRVLSRVHAVVLLLLYFVFITVLLLQ